MIQNKKNNIQIQNSSQTFDAEFINLINALNESIKEYYNVSQYNLKETFSFLNFLDPQWNSIISLLNQNLEQNKGNIIENINQCQNVMEQLKSNSLSINKNLHLFFNDAKIIFQKMREKRKEDLEKLRRRSLTIKKQDINNSSNYTQNKKILNRSFTTRHNSDIFNKKKLLTYIRQLKDFNEIVGKFSEKAKYNFINLQKLIINLLGAPIFDSNFPDNTEIFQDEEIKNEKDYINILELRNKYESEIRKLNNKIHELEKNNGNDISILNKSKKFDELKQKIEKELITGNNNNIHLLKDDDFEKRILSIIETNQKLNNELNKLKNNLNNSDNTNIQLKQDLLSKEREIMILKNKTDVFNLNDSDIRKSVQLLNKENNNLKELLKKYKNNLNNSAKVSKENTIINKNKYENHISSLNLKIENLSKNLTQKMEQIIDLQRENISLKSQVNESTSIASMGNNFNDNNNINNANLRLTEDNKNLR